MTPAELFARLYAMEISASAFRALFWLLAGNKNFRGSPLPDTTIRKAVDVLQKEQLIQRRGADWEVTLPGVTLPGLLDTPQQVSAPVSAAPLPAQPAAMPAALQAALPAPAAVPQYQQPRYVFQNPKALRFMQRHVQHQEHALNAWTVTGANLDDCEVARRSAQALLAGQAPPPDCEPSLAMAEDFAQVLFPV